MAKKAEGKTLSDAGPQPDWYPKPQKSDRARPGPAPYAPDRGTQGYPALRGMLTKSSNGSYRRVG